jgi:hypothetical protein
MAEGVGAQKVPLVFFRTDADREPVREWLKGLDEADASGHRQRLIAGAVALACWHAVRSPHGKGFVGSAN